MSDTSLVTIKRPLAARDNHIALFYIHGGGMLYGERDDLPAPYVRMILDAGYTLICADYPLAPEATLPCAVESLTATWTEYVGDTLDRGEYHGWCLFGRSAGANLALLLQRELARQGAVAPLGILDFYGYHDLADPALSVPAKAYLVLPEVTRSQVDAIVGKHDEAPTTGAKALRWSLYVYARQHEGSWLRMMGLTEPDDAKRWSLSPEDIAALPPLFITASTGDADVPIKQSKTLWRAAPHAVMHQVYYLEHDFDRDVANPAGHEAYEKALSFLQGLL